MKKIIFSIKMFSMRKKSLSLRTVYVITDKESVPNGWLGRQGRLSEEMLKEEIPDFLERPFYLSGPLGMIASFEELLSKIGFKKAKSKPITSPVLLKTITAGDSIQ